MEVLLRGHGGDGGATAVLVRCHGDHGGAAATPLRISPTRDDTAEVLNMLKVSAVPPRKSAVLTVFGGATAINDGTTAELRRSWRCGLCRTSTAVAPRIRCDGGISVACVLSISYLDIKSALQISRNSHSCIELGVLRISRQQTSF